MATIRDMSVIKPVGNNFGIDRFIGLEIETTRNLNMLPKQEDVCWTERAWEISNKERDKLNQILDPSGEMIAMIGADGADIEIATQPMSKDELVWGMKAGQLFKNINKYCVAEEASGTHIHISKLPKENRNLWRNIYWFSTVFDKQMYTIFRRKSHWARSPKIYWQNQNKRLVSIGEVAQSRYPNFGNKGTIIVKRNKTYECRAGASTTSPAELKAWALLFLNIIDFCNQKDIVGHRFEEVLPEGEYGEILKVRLTGEQLRQIVPINLYL